MTRTLRRQIGALTMAALAGGLSAVLGSSTPAAAHPLGNFTTNQYAGLRVQPSGVDIDYVLDLAELPAFQAQRDDMDADHDGAADEHERAAYAARTCDLVATGTHLDVNGVTVPLNAQPTGLTTPPGVGGLTTLRLECVLRADTDIRPDTTVDIRVGTWDTRIGWREITAVGDRATLTSSSVPATSRTSRLTSYPPTTDTSDVRQARLVASPGGPAAPAGAFPTTSDPTAAPHRGDRLTNWITGLIGHPQLTLGIGVLAALIAVVLGGAHAVAPGHGKTIMAAYLVGNGGRLSQALVVAVSVAATHTVGVLVLGAALATSIQIAPQAVYGWLKLLSGALVAAMGAFLLYRARKHRVRAPQTSGHHDHHAPILVAAGHRHGPDGHHHHHHHHRPGHHHGPAPASHPDIRSRTLAAMGFLGGLSPSPSAVVVLLGAVALGRAWYGVILVAAYGVGLAATLTGIGLALARWGHRLQRTANARWQRTLLPHLPTFTAAVILVVGVGMAVTATVALAPQ